MTYAGRGSGARGSCAGGGTVGVFTEDPTVLAAGSCGLSGTSEIAEGHSEGGALGVGGRRLAATSAAVELVSLQPVHLHAEDKRPPLRCSEPPGSEPADWLRQAGARAESGARTAACARSGTAVRAESGSEVSARVTTGLDATGGACTGWEELAICPALELR
mmetsp:Transcript_59281/g.186094  ORF Transcript_59281/g.186094 Transcript_59281/m.186094 type:complete len:162 (-) Transcript_59281:264-749(-)